MDDILFMHVFQSVTDLSDVVDDLGLCHLVVLVSYPVKQLTSGQTVKTTQQLHACIIRIFTVYNSISAC